MKSVNYTINEDKFPSELKQSEVIPLFKKEDPLKKENNRPLTLLPHLLKFFEKSYVKKQMYTWKTNFQNL